jgi:hypothetical protein
MTYEERKQAGVDYYRDRAARAEVESTQAFEAARKMGEMIPFGQPILVGHHSEGRHRRDLARINSGYDKSIEASHKAEYYREKARAAENNKSISSDDPEAVVKLREKIEKAEHQQEIMKSANKIIRKKKLSEDEKVTELIKLDGITEATARELLKPDFCGRLGFAGYATTNNNANIRRMKKRLEELQVTATQETIEIQVGEVQIIDNTEDNRVQVFFPGKPSEEVRDFLKSHGFRWARSVGAWQRHRNAWALDLAKQAANLA